MPELPEVETVVRGLRSALPGRIIRSVSLGKTDFMEDPAAIARELPGCRFAEPSRWGKFIDLPVTKDASANGRAHLVIHLGMTGRLMPVPAELPVHKHTHLRMLLDNGRELRLTDPRRFGRVALLAETQVPAFLAGLGQEPLDIREADFLRLLAGRRTMVKALLLDQRRLRGVGNIYADESLWRAGIHPRRMASRITTEKAKKLYRALRGVLTAAIRLGGSSVSDYVNANGEPGFFQLRHRVYGREGKPCFRCQSKIRRILVAGRSSCFCPRCQPALRQSTLKSSSRTK
jgi:formamidopyrimidine-DNA glycosylase